MMIREKFVTLPGFEGSPAEDAAELLIAAARQLGDSQAAAIVRAWCVPHVFGQREIIFDTNEDPVGPFNAVLRRTARLLDLFADTGFSLLGAPAAEMAAGSTESIEATTGQHYGNLFRQFSKDAYHDETASLLSMRLERNGVDLASITGKSVIDVGCGGGRYTAAWRKLGAKPALGVDISPVNIADARRRAAEHNADGLEFQEANVLQLPYKDDSFDIVFSNGVLHHTTDWEKGIAELIRVLKPGGIGWLYLIENPGGLFWDSIEILREVMRPVDRETARKALEALGIAGNRIFYMLDHVMVPINIRLTAEEVETCLTRNGATEVRRLTRGADFDRIERIYQNEPFAEQKFGAGENRYLFSKA